jgi:transmembrane protein EpsG
MIPSIIISFLLSLFALLLNCKIKGLLFSISFLIVVFLFGFRVGFGADYWNYVEAIYTSYNEGVFSNTNFGIAFENIVKASYYLGLPPEFTLFVFFLLTYYFFIKSIWVASLYYSLSLLILFFAGPFFPSLNLVRQALAFSLVLYAFLKTPYIGLVGYILITLVICLTIHLSVFILLFIPIFSRLSNRLWFWFFSLICVFFLKAWMPTIIDIMVTFYSQTSLPYSAYFVDTRYLFTDRTNTGALLYGNILVALWVAYKLPAISNNYQYSILCKAYIVGVFMVLLFSEFQAFVRLFQNYTWLVFLVLPIALSYYKDPWLRIFSIYGLVVYSITLGFLTLLRLSEDFNGGSHLLFAS